MKGKKRQGTSAASAGNAHGRVRRKRDMKSSASVTVFQENNNRWHATGIRIINHGEILRRAPQPGSVWFNWHFSRWKINRNRPDLREGESNLGESLLHGFNRWPSFCAVLRLSASYLIKLYFWAWSERGGIFIIAAVVCIHAAHYSSRCVTHTKERVSISANHGVANKTKK